MTELEQYLRTYTSVADEDMQTLLSFFKPASLAKGEFFMKAGRVCDKLSFHRSGLMRVYASYEEKEVTQWISFKGNLMSDLTGLVLNEPSRFNARALTHCELYTIGKEDYNNLSQVITKWPALERQILTRCFHFMESRIFSLLAMSAEERYKYIFALNPEMFNLVPLKYLASMMGMTPESFSGLKGCCINNVVGLAHLTK